MIKLYFLINNPAKFNSEPVEFFNFSKKRAIFLYLRGPLEDFKYL